VTGSRRAPWSWFSAVQRRRPPMRQSEASLSGVAAGGLIVDGSAGERRVPWSAIQRIMAASSAGYVRDTMLLIIELSDGRIFIVRDADPHQPALVAALDTALPGTVSSAVWQLRLMAAPEVPVEVYRRSDGDPHREQLITGP
jgi:hypothetical protein